MNNRPLVIYHGNCADGFSGAWCFWKKYGDQADYVAGSYQKPAPDVAGRDVYLVDFSYKRAVVAAMIEAATSVTLIDHHKTALGDLAALPGLQTFTDLDRSGATLAWDFLFPDQPRPLLLGHIEDRDLWRFRLAGTREVSSFVFSHDYTFDRWDKLMSADQAELLQMTAAGAAIERKHRKDVADIVRTCKRRMTIAGYDVPAASIPYTMASDAGELMAEGEPFAACYYDTSEGRKFSLRSTEAGVDVAAIAEQFGGGGHEHAAGFTVPADHVLATHSGAIAAASSDEHARVRDAALEAAAIAVEDHRRNGREWIRESLWGSLTTEAATRIRALKSSAIAPSVGEQAVRAEGRGFQADSGGDSAGK